VNSYEDPWELPSARAFLSEIEEVIGVGGAIVTGGPSLPPGLEAAIQRHFDGRRFVVERIDPLPGQLPAEALARAFNVTADAAVLAQETRLGDHLAIIVAQEMEAAAFNGWHLFLVRFLKLRAGQSGGLSLLLLTPRQPPAELGSLPVVAWNGRLRRIDVAIWAELHAPLDRSEPLATLAEALAVDVCGWRLDLAAEIARARRQDLLDPFGWLSGRVGQVEASTECKLNGQGMACPLALCAQDHTEEVNRRIWKAQLKALFPWLEAHRQSVIDRHRKLLQIERRTADPDQPDIAALEFGGLVRQLRRHLGREELEWIECLAMIRNELAHRKVVKPNVLDRALRGAQRFETDS